MDPVTQQRVVRELALRIGPIATIVVKRAALRCNSLEELYSKVAEEIDSREEREKFLREVAGGALAPSSEIADPVAVEAPRAPAHSEVTDRPSTTAAVPQKAAPSSRRYLIFGGGAVLIIGALVLAMRLAPSKGTDSSKPAETAEQTQSQETAPERGEAASAPLVQTHPAPQGG